MSLTNEELDTVLASLDRIERDAMGGIATAGSTVALTRAVYIAEGALAMVRELLREHNEAPISARKAA